MVLTPIRVFEDWRGLVGYVLGLASIPVIITAIYTIKRHRRSSSDIEIEGALAEIDRFTGFRN